MAIRRSHHVFCLCDVGGVMIKVVKFGGSSLADATQFKKVKSIIEKDSSRKIVVVSAIGKRFTDDNKITDLLYLCHAHLKYSVSYENIFSIIEDRYRSIKKELQLSFDLEREFKIIRSNMNKNTNIDYLVSRGEYLTACLMSEYLGYAMIDAKELLFFNYDGTFNKAKSKDAFDNICQIHDKIVVPGFYGALLNGEFHIMSRGGSDITGAILADFCDADVYENWTDVSGILVADPKIVVHPKPIESITYQELRELSYMGANVLHEEAIFPLKAKNIPINIKNTNEPDNPGTLILEDCSKLDEKKPPHVITGIAGRKDFTCITIYRSGLSNEYGVIKQGLQVFANYKIPVDNVPMGIDSFSVVAASEKIRPCLYELIAELKAVLQPDELKISDNLSLIAIVGRGMAESLGLSGRLFGELGANNINIRTISQGADELNILVGVDTKDFEKTIRVIYHRFIK